MPRNRLTTRTAAAGGSTGLAPYAARAEGSRGRIHAEPPPAYRGEFQRDRDRVLHSAAFRRLVYKTQVFVNHEGDMFRTRLTHSIEVAQIARTIARALRLDEDLTEAISLAHDLGHTPFGHAGQDALNACMREYGGFEHNLQSLRVVDVLEEKYPDFPGLNLMFETREGILKHCSRGNAARLGEVAQRFLDGTQPCVEAQLANLADEIAYNNHDVDDGLRAGLIDIEDLCGVALFRDHFLGVRRRWPELSQRMIAHEVVRRMINEQVTALIESTRRAIDRLDPRDTVDVRAAPAAVVRFGESMLERHRELKRFLRARLYRHYRVHRMTQKAGRIVRALFEGFLGDPDLMPVDTRARARLSAESDGESGRARVAADYIAGMTDRFAIAEYERIFNPSELT